MKILEERRWYLIIVLPVFNEEFGTSRKSFDKVMVNFLYLQAQYSKEAWWILPKIIDKGKVNGIEDPNMKQQVLTH